LCEQFALTTRFILAFIWPRFALTNDEEDVVAGITFFIPPVVVARMTAPTAHLFVHAGIVFGDSHSHREPTLRVFAFTSVFKMNPEQ
jgi:hypothetical protein